MISPDDTAASHASVAAAIAQAVAAERERCAALAEAAASDAEAADDWPAWCAIKAVAGKIRGGGRPDSFTQKELESATESRAAIKEIVRAKMAALKRLADK